MTFLIVDTDYPDSIAWLYRQHPGLENESYETQRRVWNSSFCGGAEFYSENLRKLGYQAVDIHANIEPMQRAWAREHDVKVPKKMWRFRWRRGIVPWFGPVPDHTWFYDILAAQIRHFKPDVLINLAMDWVGTAFLQEMRPYIRLLVGQIAAPLPVGESWNVYDLVISSLPNLLDFFRGQGLATAFQRLGFEETVGAHLRNGAKDIDVSFVGQIGASHKRRTELLTILSRSTSLSIWGMISLDAETEPIRACHKGPAWGLRMYDVLARSKITLNCHLDLAGPYANNLRLYEATGVGALLLTDWKENLGEMFEPGREVLTYRTPEECAEQIQRYLERDQDRKQLARAGQQRTLREHTCYHRMAELVGIVGKRL